MKKVIFLVIAVIVLIAGVFIFKYEMNKRINKNNVNKDVGMSADEITVVSKEEEGVPSGFPQDFPIYSESTLISSWTSDGKNGKGFSIVWETESGTDELFKFYTSELNKNNWEITDTLRGNNSYTLSFVKGNTFGFIGISTEGGGKTLISVTIGRKINE